MSRGGAWSESDAKVTRIVPERAINTARAAHSREGEIVKEKTICSIYNHGKDHGKTVEITGEPCRCKICQDKIKIQSGQPFCQKCGAILGSAIYSKERKPEPKQSWRGGGKFMKLIVHH